MQEVDRGIYGGVPANALDNLHDARALTRFLRVTLVQSGEVLELDKLSRQGLDQVFELIEEKIISTGLLTK